MIEDFLANFGKTLSRVNLYSVNHPLVQESVNNSYEGLAALLEKEPEVILASSEGKLLVNGSVAGGVASVQQALIQFFEKNQLYSVTFKRGLSVDEIFTFYKLFTGRKDVKGPEDFARFLSEEKAVHIAVNAAFFSKVSEKGEDGEGAGAGAGGGAGAGPGSGGGGGKGKSAAASAREKTAELMQKLENMSLDTMLWEIIRLAVPDPEDQKKIFDVIFKQLQGELAMQVEKATHALKQEKQKVVNEQERTESVIQTMAEGVVMVDSEGRIVMMNSVAENIYGRTFTEVKGQKIEDLRGDNVMLSMAQEVVSPGDRAISREIRVQSAQNTRTTLKQSTAMIENPEGKVVGMVSILNDIAKQKELQEMQDQFLHNVTHELRSPLTAMKASLATLAGEQDLKMTSAHRNLLAIANRNIDRLARLVNDILDFAKIAEGKVTVNIRPVDTQSFIQDTLSGFQSWAKTKNITLEYAANGSVPRVMADYDRITQVLVNLLSNAIKFTPTGGKVTVRTQKSPLTVEISVTDTGPGIPKLDQEKLFKKFFQLKQTEKSDVPGTGLGLYITKRIVELHKGEIGFISDEGKGTTFWFTLPLVPESAKMEAAAASSAAQSVARKKSWLSKIFGS
ncbi:MAG: hypothetical protein A2901_05090 [Elusimicrobia bacterium RIFCSPLOWO2_01_FULL_54_10]|nr:MAG: hypothetical protein A2901_05090 [Elusimicrobia bacterium RIFCSPLOWO2_01_FULL_54_10]